MQEEHLSDSFFLGYIRTMVQAKQQVITVGATFDLTLLQALTLLVLAGVKSGEISMSDFSKLYACDASNITGIVDGLEQKKLVARHLHPNDRRIKMIHLEPAGKQMQTQLLERLSETSGFMFNPLTPAERRRFAKMMIKIGDNLEANIDKGCSV